MENLLSCDVYWLVQGNRLQGIRKVLVDSFGVHLNNGYNGLSRTTREHLMCNRGWSTTGLCEQISWQGSDPPGKKHEGPDVEHNF